MIVNKLLYHIGGGFVHDILKSRLKNSGMKLHIGVDVLGLLHTIMVTTANVTDRSGAIDMVDYFCDVTGRLTTR